MKKSKALLAWALALAMLGTNVHSVRATETTTDATDIVAEQTVNTPENADAQVSAGNVGDGSVSSGNVANGDVIDGDLGASETGITAPETLVTEVPEGIAEVVVVKQKTDLNTHFEGTYKKFTVDNKKMAAVSAKGILTAKQPGTVQVTGYEKNGKVWEAKETVSILIEKPLITEKTIIRTRPELTIDGNTNLTGAEKKPTTWISSKPAVARPLTLRRV